MINAENAPIYFKPTHQYLGSKHKDVLFVIVSLTPVSLYEERHLHPPANIGRGGLACAESQQARSDTQADADPPSKEPALPEGALPCHKRGGEGARGRGDKNR